MAMRLVRSALLERSTPKRFLYHLGESSDIVPCGLLWTPLSPLHHNSERSFLTRALSIYTSPVCGDITIGDMVSGTITGTDPHFYSYRLRYESSLASGLILPVRKYMGVSDTGDTSVVFSWDTTGLPACGYRIVLEVWDRTIVNNRRHWGEPGFGWRSIKQYYFCLEAAE